MLAHGPIRKQRSAAFQLAGEELGELLSEGTGQGYLAMTAIKALLAEPEATAEQSAAVAVLCGGLGIDIIEEKDRLTGEPAALRSMLTGRVDRRWAQRHHPGMAGGARRAAGGVAALRMGRALLEEFVT